VTDSTPNRSYPFPECEPPLIKDQSDIADLRDLAEAVNDDADAVETLIEELIERPDSARIAFAGTIAVSSTIFSDNVALVPYNSTTFDNTGTSVDLGNDALRVSERGIYLFATQIRCTDGGEQNLSVRHVRNGLSFEEGRRFEGLAFPAVTNQSATTTSDVMICQVGDLIQSQFRTNGVDGTYTFEARLTMVQLVKLDV
jgi:hypothetical protein